MPPEDPGALADAIVRFYRDDLASTLREGVARRVGELSWAGLVQALVR